MCKEISEGGLGAPWSFFCVGVFCGHPRARRAHAGAWLHHPRETGASVAVDFLGGLGGGVWLASVWRLGVWAAASGSAG